MFDTFAVLAVEGVLAIELLSPILLPALVVLVALCFIPSGKGAA